MTWSELFPARTLVMTAGAAALLAAIGLASHRPSWLQPLDTGRSERVGRPE